MKFLGKPIDHAVVALADGVTFGDGAGTAVAFPGALLELRATRDQHGHPAWQVGSHPLVEGVPVVLSFGRFEVEFEAVAQDPSPRIASWSPDLRLLVATFALVLAAAWIETLERVAQHNSDLVVELRARIFSHPSADVQDGLPLDTADPAAVDAWPPEDRTILLQPSP